MIQEAIKNQDFTMVFKSVLDLKKYSFNSDFENKKGIYFLWCDNIITYIGISQKIFDRIYNCRTPHVNDKIFNYVSFYELDLINKDLEFYEYELISLFKPKDNNQNRGFLNYNFLPINYKLIKEKFEKNKQVQSAINMANYF